jgi:murein L,D-transpeptidase YcbB/YkuD
LFFTLGLLFLSACQEKSPQLYSGLNEKLNFSSSEYQTQLRAIIFSGNFTITDSLSLHYADTLKYFYSERNFQPLFIKSFEGKLFVDSLLNILGSADEHGLNPELYHFTQIKEEFFNSIKDNTEKLERYKHLAHTELLVSDAILKYAYHMRYGVLNPKEIFLDSYYLPIPDSSSRDLLQPLKQSSIIQYLNNIQPKNKKYKNLQAALKHFAAFKNLEWQKIPVPANKIKLGDRDTLLIQIAKRMITLGFVDTSKIKLDNYIAYDSLFADKIKKFQRANGLIGDGVISKSTIDKLNTTPEEYINKIKVNLERFRWTDYSDTARYILVNIPDFRLYVIENGKEAFDISVCTGRKRYANFEKQYQLYKQTKNWRQKPEDWETPEMYGEISHLILNPTWTVPSSIMREEIASKVRRDSAYLKKANFKVYKNGSRINPTEVNVKDFFTGSIPYTIIQDPGAGNALGKIKFMFDNPFGIYLHDTPTRAPFSYSNRAVSHGCVRVEKPLKLAEYILNNNSNWTIDYLKIEIGSKVNDKSIIEEFKHKRSELRKNSSYGQTTQVKLNNKIPLFIDYYTAWVDQNGVPNFRDDVYRKDKIILENLFAEK